MKVLIIDRRESDGWLRAEDLSRHFTDRGHQVLRVLQVDGTDAKELVGPWSRFRGCAQMMARQSDLILLHIGAIQNHATEFLRDCCTTTPTLCFSGVGVDPRLRSQCRKAGIHVIYPQPLAQRVDPNALHEICRWAEEVGAAGGDRGKIQHACERLENLDPHCDYAVELLGLVLRGDQSGRITELARRLKITRECTRENLSALRDDLFPENRGL